MYILGMYKWIQSIQVICCTIFLLFEDAYDLQLAILDLYEDEVHIYVHSPNSLSSNIDVCLQYLIDII